VVIAVLVFVKSSLIAMGVPMVVVGNPVMAGVTPNAVKHTLPIPVMIARLVTTVLPPWVMTIVVMAIATGLLVVLIPLIQIFTVMPVTIR